MLIAERLNLSLVQIHGNHPVSTDGGTWNPQACQFLKLKHHIHSSLEKSLIERGQCSISRIEPNALMIIFHSG
jgi:putative transposase